MDTNAEPIQAWLRIPGFDHGAPECDPAERLPPRPPSPRRRPYHHPWKLPHGRPSNPLLPRD